MVNALQQVRQEARNTIRQRLAVHKAQMATPAAFTGGVKPLNLLADGDSWFDYPLSGTLPSPTDITIQLGRLIAPTPRLLNLAYHGDATTTLLGVTKRNRLVETLRDPDHAPFDAILFSGGGNDLVGDQFRLWLEDASAVGHDLASAVNTVAFNDILGVVITAYQDLIAARDSVDHSIPIFVHAYDFALPTDNGVCDVGPWLFPSLQSRGWMSDTSPADLANGAAIIKSILIKFMSSLEALATPANNLIFVETQGTLAASEWANELHPIPDGFRKIALRFVSALAGQFPGRVNSVDSS